MGLEAGSFVRGLSGVFWALTNLFWNPHIPLDNRITPQELSVQLQPLVGVKGGLSGVSQLVLSWLEGEEEPAITGDGERVFLAWVLQVQPSTCVQRAAEPEC